MDIQEQLIKLASYKCGFKIVEDFFLINITYPKKWKIIESENKLIECGPNGDIFYYAAPLNNVRMDEVFDLIDLTIEYNHELERKAELFREKIDEMAKIFNDESYETLKTLTFKLKKKRGRHVQTKDEATETVVDEKDTSDPKLKNEETVMTEDDGTFNGFEENAEEDNSIAIDDNNDNGETPKYVEEVER